MKNRPAPLWLRFVAPSVLLLALGVTALPVLEMGVQGARQDFDSWNKMREAAGQPKAALNGKLVVLTQTSLQSVWAGCSWGPEIAEEKAQQAKVDPEVRRKFREQAKQRQKAFEDTARAQGATVTKTRIQKPGPAVLMIFSVLLLVGAMAIGYSLPSGLLRVLLFCGTIVAATGCLGLQLLIGFPFANTFPQEVTEMKRRLDGPPRFDHQSGRFEDSDKVKVFVHRLPWAHLNWPILLAAMTLASLDLGFASVPRNKKRDAGQQRDDRMRQRCAAGNAGAESGRARKPRGGDEEEESDRDRPRTRRRRD